MKFWVIFRLGILNIALGLLTITSLHVGRLQL